MACETCCWNIMLHMWEWVSHVAHGNESCHIWYYSHVQSRAVDGTWHMMLSYVRRDILLCVTWLISMRDVTLWQLKKCHWLSSIWDMILSHVQHDAFRCATWPIHMYFQHTTTHCNTLQHTTTHCNTLQHTAQHDQFKCATWLTHIVDVRYDPLLCATWRILMCDMTHSHVRQTHIYVWHD